ncbi:hypothetical protein DOTSEDRAFT_24540 [Dothistroma septosporum NZE10]|uniref:Uncharacterized protein n=1 Tax=Dothistroma septosporum (strain NZE10 / CBS 128990) TaxID=675120 RepID=N1PMB4_DOTSN|nr:hypothetical protein DOTSEDRAFT_24540 [Dothistroma septosporum NZE10]
MSCDIAKLAQTRLTEVLAGQCKDEGFVAVAFHPGTAAMPGIKEMAPAIVPFTKDDVRLSSGICVRLPKNRPQSLSGRCLAAAWDVEELERRKEGIVREDKLKSKMVV